jgi:hypothetical protein
VGKIDEQVIVAAELKPNLSFLKKGAAKLSRLRKDEQGRFCDQSLGQNASNSA